ncbi:MAG: NADH-quinone oxidoreductase subunit NuoF [Bacilli bacterium]|nr:NADH-quinone oxidoreductase subunit NuoF [Bacilli bacterium]
MAKIRNAQDLAKKIGECEGCLKAKFEGKDGKRAIVICGGTGCLSNKSQDIHDAIVNKLKEKGLENKVTVNFVGCFGFCSQGPFVKIFPENTLYRMVKLSDVDKIIENDIVNHQVCEDLVYVDPNTQTKYPKQEDIPFYAKQKRVALHGSSMIDPENVEEALGYDSFKGLAKALTMKPQEVIDEILKSGLRGRGGAGFPTGRKWQFAHDQDNKMKYVVCNGDEGDPGAFMDRSMLEANPFNVIEGMIIAGYAIGAKEGYFYVRAEYPIAVMRLKKAIETLNKIGLLGRHILGTDFSFQAHIRLGAGAFVCGEETALLNSIEGKRGMPRPRPPFPAIKGLWQKPTIINNVETLANVPYILRVGAAEYAKVGTEKSKGTKVFALGGKVNNVGLVEVPMGLTLKELVYDIGGGVPNGKKFKAIQTGGPSGGCLTVKNLDTPIDYDNLIAQGSMMGSGGAIVMDEDNCMVNIAKFYMEFIADESCGKCTPCRVGTKRILEILTKITKGQGTMQDLDYLQELSFATKNGALCGLGQTAANPVLSTMKNFRDEYEAHVRDHKCPAHECKDLMEYVIDPNKCKKCSMCARGCPVGAITGVVGKEAFKIDPKKCIKCGACMSTCKFGAISKR